MQPGACRPVSPDEHPHRAALHQIFYLWAHGRLFGCGSMKGGNKIHPAEQALLQRCDLIQTSQLIQQDHLWRKGAQCHLHCLSLWEPGKNIQRLAVYIPGKELPPFIDDRKDLLLPDELPGNTAQQCGLAAARLSNKKHPDEIAPAMLRSVPVEAERSFPGQCAD